MGIDIKELRIGNHIICNGVRAKVVDLQTCRFGNKTALHISVMGISPQTGEEKIVGAMADSDYIQPIPITEDLLTELGFEIRPFKYLLKAEKYLSGYDEIVMLERLKGEDKFEVYIYLAKEETHKTHLKYLHELENFVFMTTKKEMI